MKIKLFKKLLPILLSILIIGTSIPLQVFASTSSATKINSQTLFEASTLDTLELNIKTLPTITVTGSEKYKINNASKTRPVYNDEVVNSNVIFDCGFDRKLDATIKLNFSNCGTLNSKAIDMKLIYSDIYSAPKQNITGYDTKTFWWTAYGTPSQQTNANEWFEVGFSRYNVDISFYYHNSNTPIKLENVYFTLYSEDASKDDNGNVIYSEASSSANVASNVFLYEDTSIAYKSSVTHFKKNYKDVYYGTSSGSTNAKTKNAVSYQYKNRNSINLDMMMMYSHKTMGYHFNFVPLTACVPDEPIKTVSKKTATGNTNLEYTIKQTLPTAYDKNFKLKSLKLADILEKPIDYVSAKVLDEKEKDITKTAGTLSYDENTKKVMFEFNADYLKGISYNGQTVTMKINVVTKEKISVKEINNKSISNFNDTDVLYSNTVQTNIYYPVTVNYLDEQGNKLAESSTKDYFVGDTYSTKAKTISKYVLTETPSNADGTVINSAITVDYIYRLKDANVIVNYIDTEGNPLAESDTINGKVLDEYNTNPKSISGYELTAIPENANGTMTEDEIVVDYIYSLKPASVVVNYKTETGDKLADSITIDGKVFDEYNTEQMEFYGYELIAVPDNATGEMIEDVITVDYIYRLKGTKVIVNYIDTEKNPLAESDTINGKVFDEYTTEAKNIYGYELTAVPDNATGEMTEDEIVVNYIYSLKSASVVVNYKTETGDKLANSITIDGKVFDNYTTENKTFNGYELIAIPENANGTMTEDIIVVDYIYRLKGATVTVNYIDTEGNPLAESDTINGKVFDEYTTEAKNIYGYELTVVPNNVTGEMTEDEIVVDYIYSLKPASVIVNYKTETGDKLADSITLDGKVFDKYNTEQMEFYGYELIAVPDNATGEMAEDVITVDYIYRLKDAKVIVKYVDTENKELEKSIVIEGKVFDEYVTEQKNIKDYSFVKATPNIAGTMTEDTIEVIYTYTRTILNEVKVIETEKPVKQTNKDTPVEIEIVDTGDTNNTVKLAVMGGLLVVFIIIFVLASKKMKKK